MNHRNTISREFFSTIAVVLILGLSVMCAIQTALSAAYFVNERRTALTAILDGASALSDRFAEEGNIVTQPQGDERVQEARSGFELFNTASGALVFVASEDGQVLVHTDRSHCTVSCFSMPFQRIHSETEKANKASSMQTSWEPLPLAPNPNLQ